MTSPAPQPSHTAPARQQHAKPAAVFFTPPVGVIGKHKPREYVRIQRDWSKGDIVCQFNNSWNALLDGRVTQKQHTQLINKLNELLASAQDPKKSIFDNALAIFTLYLSPLLYNTHYKREMNALSEVLAEANSQIYNPAGLNIVHPLNNAFLFLEIEYY